MTPKCLAEIKLHVPDALKRDVQDLAMAEDRKVSEYIRVVLEDHVYGKRRRPLECCHGAVRDDEGR
jgi:hypothetical protein